MGQRRVQTFTSSPYQYMGDYAGSQDLSRCNSYEQSTSDPSHGSFDERVPFHNLGRETSIKRSLSAPMDVFDPWMLEPPPCASPMSTSSSISHPESVSTPPYTGLPIYDAVHTAFHHMGDTPAGQNTWANEAEPVWRPSYPEPTAWDSQTFVLPCHGGPSYEQRPLQSTPSFLTQPNMSASTQYMAYHTSLQDMHHSTAQSVGPATIKVESHSKKGDENDDQSDSESEFSDSDDDCSSNKWSSSASKGVRGKSNVFRLDNFPGIMDPMHTTLSQRAYECPLVNGPKAEGACRKRFNRPEHLRRHMRTVHTDVRDYICQVPGCNRPFSRSDNLREHYWTHLSRGGRQGKNRKMSFQEIRKILGPKQKQLLRRLKTKLNSQKQKNGMKAKL
ncbi:c2h2 type conidiation transcription factor [Stemphylium lycopersici]|uniref:C2h2 type conidiation transcription factor n=1 Tax=Stemphylium lycopersici TaxID=183478 RepID=A0A364N0R4_STELY|nr:c2h2 type conidiation transcription factor [Stemphylium lycopersici]